jgi:hypothetical protein
MPITATTPIIMAIIIITFITHPSTSCVKGSPQTEGKSLPGTPTSPEAGLDTWKSMS